MSTQPNNITKFNTAHLGDLHFYQKQLSNHLTSTRRAGEGVKTTRRLPLEFDRLPPKFDIEFDQTKYIYNNILNEFSRSVELVVKCAPKLFPDA